jgi:hypothetical protein
LLPESSAVVVVSVPSPEQQQQQQRRCPPFTIKCYSLNEAVEKFISVRKYVRDSLEFAEYGKFISLTYQNFFFVKWTFFPCIAIKLSRFQKLHYFLMLQSEKAFTAKFGNEEKQGLEESTPIVATSIWIDQKTLYFIQDLKDNGTICFLSFTGILFQPNTIHETITSNANWLFILSIWKNSYIYSFFSAWEAF